MLFNIKNLSPAATCTCTLHVPWLLLPPKPVTIIGTCIEQGKDSTLYLPVGYYSFFVFSFSFSQPFQHEPFLGQAKPKNTYLTLEG